MLIQTCVLFHLLPPPFLSIQYFMVVTLLYFASNKSVDTPNAVKSQDVDRKPSEQIFFLTDDTAYLPVFILRP